MLRFTYFHLSLSSQTQPRETISHQDESYDMGPLTHWGYERRGHELMADLLVLWKDCYDTFPCNLELEKREEATT